jgi:CheY-like chemotaxis protein
VGSTPAARTILLKMTQPFPNKSKAAGGPKRVLLLEDEGALTEILQLYLELNGWEVTAVTNGVDGLKHVMAADFDVIVCDMMMEKLAGDMFYTAVQRSKPQLCKRFVFMTGYKGNTKIEDFIRKINGVMLWKPFEPYELLDTMRSVLQSCS